ncbi:MAG: M48 family metallopeptidase [Burkholderiaceae bacterium]|jgi:Zn-dependent protease with chaperone function|nr:M48 family metallopeptidase [Burkholderiaceae bacterium]
MDGTSAARNPSDTGAVFRAVRFDGRSALAQPVRLRIDGDSVQVAAATHADAGEVAASAQAPLWQGALRAVQWSEAFRHAPRQALLPDGSTLEIDETERLDRVLAAGGLPPSRVERLQRNWPAALGALFSLLLITAAAYLVGLPAAANWAAFNVTDRFEQRFGQLVLQQMDEGEHLQPSAVPPERQRQIAERFAAAAARAAPDVQYTLLFRDIDGPGGVNAFALPGGTIVMLDGLVLGREPLAALTDDQLLGVLGHELGHVRHKHVMRRLIQTAGGAMIAAVLWGDFAGLAANAPVLLGALQYTRDFEREADDFAVAFLHASGLSTSPLLEFFRQIETLSGKSYPPAFLSTHPSPRERIERLQPSRGTP